MIFIMLMMISFIMILLPNFLNMKMRMNKNKSSAFECGFDMINSARNPFSLHFFKFCLIFIIFDIEIIVILPTPMVLYNSTSYLLLFNTMIITFLSSLLIEWQQNSLTWS
uniref:NADH-ubiquinone oxidoreductase chain 3 n=1 Tax=Tinaminyssus melloi TaxID=105222 RepID=A0A5Q0RZ87_9ACAR|nr:NADH dehydrogenase subunit 3 [Tinaminyssus melloi]QGA47511.1 NADH dehydrogenase subunit 3 [Tinaminyssus melloi]